MAFRAYLLYERDKGFLSVVQEAVFKMSLNQGVEMSTYQCDASQSPFLGCGRCW